MGAGEPLEGAQESIGVRRDADYSEPPQAPNLDRLRRGDAPNWHKTLEEMQAVSDLQGWLDLLDEHSRVKGRTKSY